MNAIESGRRLWRDLRGDAERWSLACSALATMSVKIGGVFCAFLASMVMARALGPSGYGLYAYVMAVVTVLAVPAALGLPQYLVREASGRAERLLALRRWADRWVTVAGAAVALLMLLIAWAAGDADQRWLFLLAALIPLLTGLSGVRRGLLQAGGLVARSQFAPLVLVPLVLLVGVAGLWRFGARVEAWEVMLLTLVASALPWLVNGVQLRRVWSVAEHAGSQRLTGITIGAAMRFMWLGALYLLLSRTDLIMLGVLSDDANAGVYAVASRAADLVPLLLTAANMVIAPRVARLYRAGELQRLQELLTSTMRMVVWASLPMVLLLFFGAGRLLPLLYGEAYVDGVSVLRLLVVSQFILVLGGPLGTTLEMTGNEGASLMIMIWVVALNVALNFLLIPAFDANGAAAATCLSVIVGRILLWHRVRKLLSLRPTALGV